MNFLSQGRHLLRFYACDSEIRFVRKAGKTGMNSSSTIQEVLTEIVEHRKSNAKQLQHSLENLDSLNATLSMIESQFDNRIVETNEFNQQVLGPATAQLTNAQLKVSAAQSAFQKIVRRWGKETITIGVAGKARQGKTELLQAITGLGDDVLPASDGLPITGARSHITCKSGESRFTVNFLTQEEFLGGIVREYYNEIQLKPSPQDWRSFTTKLPTMPGNASVIQRAQYELLQSLHSSTNAFDSLLGSNPLPISKHEVVDYVSQSNSKKYLAVKQVDIETSFPGLEDARLSVIDLPGLGEIARGHSAKLTETLQDEADVVLYVKFPPATGDKWGEDDMAVADCVVRAVPEIPLQKFLHVVLNVHKSGENGRTVRELEEDLPECLKGCRLSKVVAKNHEDARENFFLILLQDLIGDLPKADSQRLAHCRGILLKAIKECEQLLKSLQSITGTLDAGDRKYFSLHNDFLDNLSNQLESLLVPYYPGEDADLQSQDSSVQNKSLTLTEDLRLAIQESLMKLEASPPTFDEERLRTSKARLGGWPGAIQSEFHSMRSFLSQQLGNDLEQRFVEIFNRVRLEVYSLLLDCGLRSLLINLPEGVERNDLSHDELSTELIQKLIDIANMYDEADSISKGLSFIRNMNISYQVQIHPRIRSVLSSIDPMNRRNCMRVVAPQDDPNRSAADIRRALEVLWLQVCYEVRKPLEEVVQSLGWGVFATLEECRDSLLRAKESSLGWNAILFPRKHLVWSAEFQESQIKFENDMAIRESISRLESALSTIPSELVFE